MTERREAVLVVGLGNPILGDDGVGWRVIDVLDGLLDDPAIAVERLAVGGVTLMERLLGHATVVLVDAILDDGPPGTTWCRPLASVVTRAASHLDSSHDASLPAALAAARALGADIPDEVLVVGIAIDRSETFSEALSPPVAAAVGTAVALVLDVIGSRVGSGSPVPA